MLDLTPDEVLLLERVGPKLVVGSQVVGLVCECDRALKLMVHGANEDATDSVIVLVPLDHAAIFELHLLVA